MGTAWKVEGTKSLCANDSDFAVVFVLFKRELRRVEEFEKIAGELGEVSFKRPASTTCNIYAVTGHQV